MQSCIVNISTQNGTLCVRVGHARYAKQHDKIRQMATDRGFDAIFSISRHMREPRESVCTQYLFMSDDIRKYDKHTLPRSTRV